MCVGNRLCPLRNECSGYIKPVAFWIAKQCYCPRRSRRHFGKLYVFRQPQERGHFFDGRFRTSGRDCRFRRSGLALWRRCGGSYPLLTAEQKDRTNGDTHRHRKEGLVHQIHYASVVFLLSYVNVSLFEKCGNPINTSVQLVVNVITFRAKPPRHH